MNPKQRIYSLPYNGTNPEWFVQEAEKRKQNIDHVYCELPSEEMLSHVRFLFDGKDRSVEEAASGIVRTVSSVEPERELVELYGERYALWRELYPRLRSLYPALQAGEG